MIVFLKAVGPRQALSCPPQSFRVVNKAAEREFLARDMEFGLDDSFLSPCTLQMAKLSLLSSLNMFVTYG